MSGFPWREAMAFGLGVLRLPPSEFWRMTPRELASLRVPRTAPPSRERFDELSRRYPDRPVQGERE